MSGTTVRWYADGSVSNEGFVLCGDPVANTVSVSLVVSGAGLTVASFDRLAFRTSLASTIGVIEDYIASGDVDGLSDALYRTSTLIQGNKHLEIVARMQFQAIPRLVRALKEFVRGPTRVQTPIILLLEQFSRSTTSNCVAIAKSCPHALGTIGIVVSTHAHDAEPADDAPVRACA